MRAAAAIAQHADWREALTDAVAQSALAPGESAAIDLVILFASADYAAEFPELLATAGRLTGAGVLIGCSGQGVIGLSREIEGRPALSLMCLSLPGAELQAFHISQSDLALCSEPQDWHGLTGVLPEDVNAWLALVDPFTLDAETLVDGLSAAYPGVPVIGGLASGDYRVRGTHVFLNDEAYNYGAILLAVGGPYTVRTIVSQGATPIGDTWIITSAHDNIIETIAQRPAYEVLVETFRQLPPDMQRRAQRNLLIGLAMDEYKDEFHRGDFLIRNLLGYDPESGALAVGALLRVGQTIQFQVRDPAAADDDLRELLSRAKGELGERAPGAALMFCCNGRGAGLFGMPDHDASAVASHLGAIPLAGFFCNGEIGPVGERTFLHGYTASIALILPRE